MPIKISIHHKTEYRFDKLTKIYPHLLRLRPASHYRNKIVSYSLKVTPDNHYINWQQDPYGNFLARLNFLEESRHLAFEVNVVLDMQPINPFDFFVDEAAEYLPFEYEGYDEASLKPYLEVTEQGPLLQDWVETLRSVMTSKKMKTIDFLVLANQQMQSLIQYEIRLEPGVQTPEETLALRTGSCRDTSWALIQGLRSLGFACRFASGYLVQLASDQKSLDGPSGPESDFTDLHAWCEVYLPGAGWIGLDPTSGLLASEGHIPLACTPSPESAAPISGATSPCEVEFSYDNKITRIKEDPRVTKPYQEAQWKAIDALGNAVDKVLLDNDIRLTMGGEPTFVSATDYESEQWNSEALGQDKLKLSHQLMHRLKKRIGPKGVIHFGQGKWYPGEPLNRWSIGCVWRKDGQPIWEHEHLMAEIGKEYHFPANISHQFSTRLATHLGLHTDFAQAVYEDAFYYAWKEQQLPENVNAEAYQADDPQERKRLAKVLSNGLSKAAGHLLPLEWNYYTQCWRSSQWPLRNDRIVLIPGDSPIGLRLPLDALPYETTTVRKRKQTHPRDPFAPLEPLPPANQTLQSVFQNQDSNRDNINKGYNHDFNHENNYDNDHNNENNDEDDKTVSVVRKALCVELRDGYLRIFMPPLDYAEHYLQLVQAIEQTAKELNTPIILEGYEAPIDARLDRFQITPDPGVIEVNVQPSSDWQHLVFNTNLLYEEAYQCRLNTQKYQLDGRQTGTGGGNHITLGGYTPNDSPFLRRPDLLRSIITYWQHHPALSYFFSGQFIGPTSQAPRVDEGRQENLYNLEIAFSNFPADGTHQPWLIDRLLRNLLIDVTGNTHRTEICIDKLYSPDHVHGRQGLIEFRGFEMPPHSQMSLVQMLLLRALVARFWTTPYTHKLVRWGSQLHDKFMLPHFLYHDMLDVVADLNAHGFSFDPSWLTPFTEFRFPKYGAIEVNGITLELRHAIEPWNVLGEEAGNLGTARFVDSSLERLQIKVSNMVDARYQITCNGRAIPLQATGVAGEYVAGVRYKAWQPPSALHPTIGIHSPLVFDIIDTWNQCAVGGCTYHVVHPGGRGYDTFPVNHLAAESRQLDRFQEGGHSPSLRTPIVDLTTDAVQRHFMSNYYKPIPTHIAPNHTTKEHPMTLDLRL